MTVTDAALVEHFPDIALDHDNKAHYAAWLDRRLVVNRCDECGRLHHPPRSLCADCWSPEVTPVEVSGRGTVYLKVTLHQGPVTPEVDYAEPHTVVTVELDEQPGLRYAGMLVGPSSSVDIGSRVHLAWATRRGAPYPVWEAGDDG